MQAIRQANERFDIVMRATNDMIWDWNLETNEIYRDSFGVARVYGLLDPEETSNLEKWLNRVHPEDREQVLFAIEHLTEGKKQTFEIEYRFRTEDNEWRFIYDRGMALHNERGRPIRMIGSAQNISERKKLEMEIRNNMLERQRAINQATVETQEMERKEIGSELHDNVNQVLTTTKLYLELATSHPELKDEMIQKSTANIIKVINEIRQLSRSLMEPSIGDLGLVEAISDLVENLNMTRKLHVLFRADDGFDEVLTKNQKLTLFRIIQEATNNIIRHSGAKFTSIVLEKETDSGKLIIEDNGNGFHPEKVKRGTGLNNIKNRVYLVNGDCRIESAPGIGTRILIQFPIINATNNQHP
jgi:PAS domain S-box-containing protein